MKIVRSYFANAYRFMVDADIRYGEEFHFVPFFLLSVLFPVNVLLLVLLEDYAMIVLISEQSIAFLLGLIFSFFPGFKRGLRNVFNMNGYRKEKLKFGAYLKGYLLIIGVAVSPCILALIRLLFISQESP